MTFTIPDAIRQQMRQQATAAGMPYGTLVGQKVYDLQGLVDVLTSELQQAQQAGDSKKIGEVTGKLTHHQAELAAYKAEQQTAGSS
ncbi:MAG: hypothetical protein LC793_15345 [Thermomicrobia bacterium]|nr:hypothetical protein [Thermomicrobia bacterium]